MTIERLCNFFLDKEKGKADAKLRFRVKWEGYTVAFGVGYRIELEKWSTETQRCIHNTTHGKKKTAANVINRKIQQFEQYADEVFVEFEKADKCPTEEEYRAAFNAKRGKKVSPSSNSEFAKSGFFEVYDEFTRTMGLQNSWSPETYVKFRAIKNHLLAFDSKLSFDKVSDEMMHEYLHYLFNVPMKNTTIAKHIDFVAWFLRWAHKKGYYEGNVHDTFKPKLKGADNTKLNGPIYFSWDELMHFYTFQFPKHKQYLDRVRDVVCFCCFSSLRHSDVFRLTRSDIKDDCIERVTKKTTERVKIELNDFTREILDKYKDYHFEGDKALPVISLDKTNEYIKEAGKLAGFDEPVRRVYFVGSERHEVVMPKHKLLSSHIGRRTFIVNGLYLGIPAEVIMSWTGHADYDSMKPYVAIVKELKRSEMDKFNKVPASKKGD